MNLHSLADFLAGALSPGALAEEVAPEVEEYRLKSQKIGSALPVYADGADFHFLVTPGHIRRLCDAYLRGPLTEAHLSYICNLIELSSSFSTSDEDVEEAIFLLADPEVNGEVTPERVKQISESL